MDFQKINNRWIYELTLTVFLRNIVTYIIISFLIASLGIGQALIPFIGLITIPITFYLGTVSFVVAHKTILQDAVISPGEAFEITPLNKTYFWQYLFVAIIPAGIIIFGILGLIFTENENLNVDLAAIAIFATAIVSYYFMMAFFGTSLVATALEADGMMMVSRGRVTFFYSLSRLVILPTLALAAIIAGVYYGFIVGRDWTLLDFAFLLSGNAGDAVLTVFAFLTGLQLTVLLLNLITAVVITKAFLLAEVRLALNGQPTEWAKRSFGISDRARGVVFK